jgi:proteasome lid subunit RPN8/RPN11
MTVIIPKEVYFTVVAACVRFANKKRPKDDWKEVSGIFTGKIVERKKEKDLYVSAAYPIMHDTFDPNSDDIDESDPRTVIDGYEYSDEDHASFALIDEEAFSRGEFTVGWWHSHPGFKVMLSGFGDRKTTISYQAYNPLAIALVFNPERLIRQIELPQKAGDPIKQLREDPGFKIFRMEDPNDRYSNFYEIDYQIEGFDDGEQMVRMAQKLAINITNFFSGENVFEFYDKYINSRIAELNSLLQGVEEYLHTLTRKGETNRIHEVLSNQTRDIRKFIAETFIKVENIREFTNYLEYKERSTVIPKVETILAEWDNNVSQLNAKLTEIAKKFAF